MSEPRWHLDDQARPEPGTLCVVYYGMGDYAIAELAPEGHWWFDVPEEVDAEDAHRSVYAWCQVPELPAELEAGFEAWLEGRLEVLDAEDLVAALVGLSEIWEARARRGEDPVATAVTMSLLAARGLLSVPDEVSSEASEVLRRQIRRAMVMMDEVVKKKPN